MKYLYSLSFFLLAIILFSRCNEGSFSQVTVIELPEHEPVLALSSHLNNGMVTWAQINKSRSILEGRADDITNATIELSKNDVLQSSLNYSKNFGIYRGPRINAEPGDFIKLKITHEGKEYTATQEILELPSVESVKYAPQSVLSFDGEKMDEVSIKLSDKADQEDFYRIEIFRNDIRDIEVSDTGVVLIYDTFSVYVESIDPIVSTSHFAIFSDNSFDGKEYTIKLLMYSNGQDQQDESVFARVSAISKGYYYYLKAYNQYQESDGNPFSEPVVLPSNLEGGLGFFSMSNGITIQSE